MLWFAAKTIPQKEFKAAESLRDNGLTVFLPVEFKWRRRSGINHRRVRMPYPIIPGYVLIAFETRRIPWDLVFGSYEARTRPRKAVLRKGDLVAPELQWRRNRLVRSIVGAFGVPQRIPQAVMEYLFQLTASSDSLPSAGKGYNPHKSFKVGDMVRLVTGSFPGFEVKVEEIDGATASIMMQMFGAEHKVRVSVDNLEAV